MSQEVYIHVTNFRTFFAISETVNLNKLKPILFLSFAHKMRN